MLGLAKVAGAPRPGPKDATLAVVELKFVSRFEPPLTLAEIKQARQFAGWALRRESRLSTMVAPEEFAVWMRARFPLRRYLIWRAPTLPRSGFSQIPEDRFRHIL